MNVTLHIERLILDGVPLAPGQRDALQAAVEAELARLLADGGLAADLMAGGAAPSVRGGSVQLAEPVSPAGLGRQIAGAVYEGIGR